MLRLITLTLAASFAATAAIAQSDSAADYPNKTVRIVVAGEAGGGIDTVARMLAPHLRQTLGQPFVVENRGGASGNVGAQAVFSSKPDGYMLLASSLSPITITALLMTNVNFEPSAFEPVIVMSRIPNVLAVRQNFPAKTVGELLAYSKANEGKVTYASPGVGTAAYLSTELFSQITRTKLIHIPYKGTAPLLVDLVGDRVDLTFAQIAAVHPFYKGGKLRILATATDKRLEAIPEIPTLAEIGVHGAESETWNAISAPPKTPASIVGRLNTAFNEALNAPDVKARFRDMYLLPGGGNPAEVKKFVRDETARWGGVIRAAGIKPKGN